MRIATLALLLTALVAAGCSEDTNEPAAPAKGEPGRTAQATTAECATGPIVSHGPCSDAAQTPCVEFLDKPLVERDAALLEALRSLGRLDPGDVPADAEMTQLRADAAASCEEHRDAVLLEAVRAQ